jgi:hypothetical protein
VHRLATIPLALLLAACAGVPSNLEGPPERGGVILATVTMGYTGRFFERVGFYFRDSRGSRFRLDSAVPGTVYPMLESTPDPGLEEQNGLLYAFALPPGEVRLEEVRIFSVPAIAARLREPLTVPLGDGETVYIGNLHVELCHRQGASGPDYVQGGHPSVTDRSDRDLPLLRARFHWLEGRSILRRVPEGGVLAERTCELCKRCPRPGRPATP